MATEVVVVVHVVFVLVLVVWSPRNLLLRSYRASVFVLLVVLLCYVVLLLVFCCDVVM